jgi:hypothetical protein
MRAGLQAVAFAPVQRAWVQRAPVLPVLLQDLLVALAHQRVLVEAAEGPRYCGVRAFRKAPQDRAAEAAWNLPARHHRQAARPGR